MTTLDVSVLPRATQQLRNKNAWDQLLKGSVDAIHVKSFAQPATE
jgi:hypothetical protein